MEFKLRLIVLLFSISLTGLKAGLCFTWSNAVTPRIGSLDDQDFLRSFQAMNRAIINKTFLLVFFGPVFLLFLNAYLLRSSPISFWLFLVTALLFTGGVGMVTIFGNVPLNEMLDKTDLNILSEIELKELRTKFENPWNQWHLVRTIISIVSFTLLLVGSPYIK